MTSETVPAKQFFISVVVFLFLVSTLAGFAAWTAPTQNPTAGNTAVPLSTGTTPQSKGGGVVPSGAMLNINGVGSANYLYAWNNATILGAGGLTVSGLVAGANATDPWPRPVCVDANHKLYIC